jgi:hypothetical protein
VEKLEGMRPLGRPRSRWEESVEMDLKYDGRVWDGLIWLRLGPSSGLL